MTDNNKPVKRRSSALIRDGGKLRRLVVTIYPNNTLGIRPELTRREEIVTLTSIWDLGVKQRVAAERKAKAEATKAKLEFRRRQK